MIFKCWRRGHIWSDWYNGLIYQMERKCIICGKNEYRGLEISDEERIVESLFSIDAEFDEIIFSIERG